MDMAPSTTTPSSPHAASSEAACPPLISDLLEEGCWDAGNRRGRAALRAPAFAASPRQRAATLATT